MNRKSRIFRILPLVLIALVAGLIAGCSSADEKNNYVDEVNAIQQETLDAVTAATSADPSDTTELAAQLDESVAAIDKAITDMQGVDVPEEAQEGHDQMIAGLEDMKQLFADTADQVKGATPEELLEIVPDLQAQGSEIGTKIDAAISKINEDIGATG